MLSEIGSNFWLNPHVQLQEKLLGSPSQFNCIGEDYVWLSTGRSAIKYVIEDIESRRKNLKKVAVLPSFTCDTVFAPFLKAGYEVFYYPVKNDLTTNTDDILRTVIENNASIVLFHRYFGFDTLDGQVDRLCVTLRESGIFTVEDCTQCLYSNIPRSNSDYTVGSIRKWTGTPDGGFAITRLGHFGAKPQEHDSILEKAKVKASYAKYRYLFEHEGGKSEMLEMYREAEDILDMQSDIYKISPMSAKVQANLNVDKLTKKRRDNYIILSHALCNKVQPLFSLEESCSVPLYYPILVNDRKALQKHLAQNNIYAPIVWPKDEKQPKVCDGAENAYQQLLCIPIDQRYDADDMNRIAEVINYFYCE